MRVALEPGEDSTSTARIAALADGRRRMQWHVRLPNGKLERHTTTGKLSDKEIRRRARAKAEELCRGQVSTVWKTSSLMEKYIEEDVIPYIRVEMADILRPNTVKRYVRVIDLYKEQARGFRIADAVLPFNLEKAFRGVAREHGQKTALQAKKVVSGYVIDRLIELGVLQFNPIRGRRMRLPEVNKGHRGTGGRALSRDERLRVIDYLLEFEPAVDTSPKQGRYTPQQRAERMRVAVDVTLLQAVCGLRISEARTLRARHVDLHAEPVTVEVVPELSKTHQGRICPVTDGRVAERLRARVARCAGDPDGYVFPAPAVPGREWDKANAQKSVRELYDLMADELEIPLLRDVSSHVWRATLNTEWRDRGIPKEIRAAYFGHSPETNERYYTDRVDISGLVGQLVSGDD